VGGILTSAALGVIGPPVGAGIEFSAIAAVVLGGASLAGGIGRVEKTLIGAVILAMVLNYLTLRGIPDIWQQTVTGLLVLGAVLIDRVVRRPRNA
jgi:ribose transport system permease protein